MAELNYYWVKDEEGEEIDDDTLYLAHNEQEAIEIAISKMIFDGYHLDSDPATCVAGMEEDLDADMILWFDAPSFRRKEHIEKAEAIVTPIWNGLSSEEKEGFWKQANEDVCYVHNFCEPFLHGKTWQEDEWRLIRNISALIAFDFNMDALASWDDVKKSVAKRVEEICEPLNLEGLENLARSRKACLKKYYK